MLENERREIRDRLSRASQILDSVADYQAVYEKLMKIDSLLQKEQFEEVVANLEESKSILHRLGDTKDENHDLYVLLQRAFNRKSTRVHTIMIQLLFRYVVTDSNSLTVYSRFRFPACAS